MALSGVSQATDTSIYQPHTPAPTTVFSTDGLTGAAAPAVAKTDAADAEALSSIIAKLGGKYTDAQQTYNASGLLNSASLAGQAQAALAIAAPSYEQDFTDFAVVNAESESASGNDSGVYTATGDLQNLPISAFNVRNAGGIVNTQA